MPKITATEIKALGFVPEQFSISCENEFSVYISTLIEEESALLKADIGSDLYNSCDAAVSMRIKRIEKCRTAAEMISRRINIRLSSIPGAGEGVDLSEERRQRDRYLAEAESLLIGAGGSTEYAGGVVKTSHFEEAVE